MAAAAFPAFHVTGAVHHYVRWPGLADSAAIYLGTAESTPQLKFVNAAKPVMNDITGPMLPAQKVEGGEMATIAVAFNRFSAATRALLVARDGGGRRGRFSRGLLRFGRTTFELWQVFENYLNADVRALYPSMSIGFYWPQVEMVGRDMPRLGNQDELWVPTFEAQPLFVPQADPTTVGAGEREFYLYSQDPANFPAGVQVPQ